MATIREYFERDAPSHTMGARRSHEITTPQGETIVVESRVQLDFFAGAKYVFFFLPGSKNSIGLASYVISSLCLNIANDLDNQIEASYTFNEDIAISSSDLLFTGRMFLYIDSLIEPAQKTALVELAAQHGLALKIRDNAYAFIRTSNETPRAFISHDSRDKEAIARPLALKLSSLLCPVWYDEFSLIAGARLRESIEKGIRECRKCIVILSPNFLRNERWSKVEFNSAFTREIVECQDVILPIWSGITVKDVYDYCPSLADRLALNWEDGVDNVAGKLYRVLTL
ncbi:MAG: toll/interleukin-1 receptor domain-containing protein [Candidatus Eremiobacteraeota bacterium]|nr:toll/interleukin-1 receptor domain-containing protein [Candidatus Eremiobacteraeota bacterium]